jgi:hypothetical protein
MSAYDSVISGIPGRNGAIAMIDSQRYAHSMGGGESALRRRLAPELDHIYHLHEELCASTKAQYSQIKRRLVGTHGLSSEKASLALAESFDAIGEDLRSLREDDALRILEVAQNVGPSS